MEVNMDISDGFVWVVQDRVNGLPVVMSVHTEKGYAWEAALEYMGDDRTKQYSVHPMKLNQHFVSPFDVPAGKPLTTQGE
jgi:hypothetical protein